MSGNHNDVIDLTESFTLIDHCQYLPVGQVICLDDSVNELPNFPIIPERRSLRATKTTKNKKSTSSKKSPKKSPSKRSEPARRIGDCPVCWDELGKNTLASTKCGHVFCLHCIEQVVKITKSCPTCRRTLKGASAYHPIYLSLN